MATKLVADDAPLEYATAPGMRASLLMRAVNTSMRVAVANVRDPIAFFCECGSNACFVVCWMTRVDFDAHTRADAGWILSEGHDASEPWAEALYGRRSPGRAWASPNGEKARNAGLLARERQARTGAFVS